MGDRPIIAPASALKETVIAFAEDQRAERIEEVYAFIHELYRLGSILGWDAFRLCVQSALESNNWRSVHWVNRLNPGAIGVTDHWDQQLGWQTGEDAARVMLVHTSAYLLGGDLPAVLTPYRHLDPRFEGVLSAGYGGSVQDFGDYGNGKWATDPRYSSKLRAREGWMRQFEIASPAPAPASPTGEAFARICEAQVGKPYVWGAKGPDAFDCSGMVSWGASQLGLTVSGDSHAQYTLGTAVAKDALRPGDVLCYDTMGGREVRQGNRCSHVGVYLGPGRMVNALNERVGVVISDPFSSYFAPRYLGARRLFPAKVTDEEMPVPTLPPPVVETPEDETPLTLDFPLYQTIIPRGQTNQRPGTRQTPTNVVNHETANYNVGAGAAMHSRWLLGGAQGHSNQQVSVHFFVDDHECYQMLPLDEVSYNAGCGSCAGNYGGVSIELCVNQDGDYTKARRNAALLAAWVLHQIGKDERSYNTHQSWSGKWCPALMLNRGLVANQQEQVASFLAGYAEQPVYVFPSPIEIQGVRWDGTHDVTLNGARFHGEVREVHAKQRCEVRQWGAFDAAETRDALHVGTPFMTYGWVNGEERLGEKRWWVTQSYSRVWVGDTEETPGTSTPIEEPDHPDNPRLPDTPDHLPKILDGRRVYVASETGEPQRVTVTRDELPVRAFADPAAPVLRTFNIGDVFAARYWVIGMAIEDEPVYWVLESGDVVWAGGTAERPN